MRLEKKEQKPDRLLEIFLLAMKGEQLSVQELSQRYIVSSRSVTRDINVIKCELLTVLALNELLGTQSRCGKRCKTAKIQQNS